MPARTSTRLAVRGLATAALVVSGLAGATAPSQAHYGPTAWDCMAHYESSHRWHINTGNGYYGGLQFSLRTWKAYGGRQGTGNYWPHRATRLEQIKIAKRVAFYGWRGTPPQGGRDAWPYAWPRCH